MKARIWIAAFGLFAVTLAGCAGGMRVGRDGGPGVGAGAAIGSSPPVFVPEQSSYGSPPPWIEAPN